jgi:hypothetical protein
MKKLAEEIRGILKASIDGDDGHLQEEEPEPEEGSLCEDTGTPCWQLQEAAQFIAEDMSEVMGVDPEVLSVALTEAMKCDSKCGEKYRTKDGGFKGGRGEAFKTCEEYAKACCSGVKDAGAFCAYLGRRAGKI